MTDSASSPSGRICTFYSYKGGVGRSMALASVAVLMAQWGHKVLVVDWDLEAPGLDRYFEALVSKKKLRAAKSAGVVGIVDALSRDRHAGWKDSAISVPVPGARQPLDFIPAGWNDHHYADRLQQLDWDSLFRRHDFGNRLEDLRDEWLRAYDFVLIDSRTGITDIGGICTIYLPDIVVAMFTSNHQSVEGVAEVINRARRARSSLPVDRGTLACIPVPARDESRTEYEQSLEWRREYDSLLGQFYLDFLPRDVSPADALDLLRIPSVPYWSFGERLPVLSENPSDPSGITYYYAILARLLTTDLSWNESAPPLLESAESTDSQVKSSGVRNIHAGRDLYISNTYTDRRTPTSAYLEQVQDLAPRLLLERDNELAELTAFCYGDDPYVWWQGAPWSGKTALMSWFVLHPPPEIDVISFFVATRLAGQANSSAYSEAVLEQLAFQLEFALPAFTTSAARDSLLRLLLRARSEQAEEEDKRLVLVIDGLDADQSRAAQPQLPSIAALLPSDPPPNLRVILSGRPNPPLPPDVSDSHPLRALPVVRLKPSHYAEVQRRLANDELQALMKDSLAHQDVVGYLTVSRSGLSKTDLEELTGLPPYQMESALEGATGRSISYRKRDFANNDQDAYTYLMAHEALLEAASSSIGPKLLDGYVRRIHGWADSYAERGWPESTPRYLLDEYSRLLLENASPSRIIDYALDERRHERMLRHPGGRVTACQEIRMAQRLILNQGPPDFAISNRLAVIESRICQHAKI